VPTFEETLADTDELLGRVSAWRLSPGGWEEVHAQLTLLEDALARGDVPEARLALSRVELAGPSLGPSPISPGDEVPEAAPQVVNQTIERIGAAIASHPETPSDDDR